MIINNWNVYNLEEAIVGSGLPMLTEYNNETFKASCIKLKEDHYVDTNPHMARAIKLAKLGSPHCNFLTGILVVVTVTASQAFFLQAHRYHWWQVVSSQSKMHRLKKMIEDNKISVNDKVSINTVAQLADIDTDNIEELVYNCPMGLETTEMVTLNYMQLKNIYSQRYNHRLQEWKWFCNWITNLPLANKLIINK